MRKEVYTDKGAKPAGIYSQGIVADGPVAYIASQGPLDPATGKRVEGGFREQAARVFDNLTILLEAAGTSLGTRDQRSASIWPISTTLPK